MNFFLKKRLQNAGKPKGFWGAVTLGNMNKDHAKLTDEGLSKINVKPDAVCLDIGCGGGRTLSKLSALAPKGKIYGIDISETAVRCAKNYNVKDVASEKMQIRTGDVAFLPYPTEKFDVVTAVETFYFWQNKQAAVQNVYNVLKKDGEFIVMLDAYEDGTDHMEYVKREIRYELNTPDEIKAMFEKAGFSSIEVVTGDKKLFAIGIK